jgi:hypothetical protein
MNPLLTLALYLVPFLLLALAVRRWMARKGLRLDEIQGERNFNRKQPRFLLGFWRGPDRRD